jgi:hypothetical protein
MREVLKGNLEHRVAITRHDEIGFLATSFNEMTGGLAERARIRAVIDKVVSPEVATSCSRAARARRRAPRGDGALRRPPRLDGARRAPDADRAARAAERRS